MQPIQSPSFAVSQPFPKDAMHRSRQLLAAVAAGLPPGLSELAQQVRAQHARFDAEFGELARLLAVDLDMLVLANVSYDLFLSLGCSTVAVATDRGPVVARNMDWWPEDLLARASCRLAYGDPDAPTHWQAGWIGAVGAVNGMSARGFAIVLNAVSCGESGQLSGYPVLLLLRSVLEDADSFDTAVSMLHDTVLAAPALLTVVGSNNDERVVIERTPSHAGVRRPHGDAPLVATNDYRLLSADTGAQSSELQQSACGRFVSVTELSTRLSRDPDDQDLLAVLTDSQVQMQITAQHIVMRPGQQRMSVFSPARFHQ